MIELPINGKLKSISTYTKLIFLSKKMRPHARPKVKLYIYIILETWMLNHTIILVIEMASATEKLACCNQRSICQAQRILWNLVAVKASKHSLKRTHQSVSNLYCLVKIHLTLLSNLGSLRQQ
jgi:hypothetical protein